MDTSDVEPRWSLAHRIAFRFVFAYLALYLPAIFFNAIPSVGPETDYYAHFWDPVVVRVGQKIFGVEISMRPNGSGDTTWNSVQVFIFAAIAVLVAAFWSVADQ